MSIRKTPANVGRWCLHKSSTRFPHGFKQQARRFQLFQCLSRRFTWFFFLPSFLGTLGISCKRSLKSNLTRRLVIRELFCTSICTTPENFIQEGSWAKISTSIEIYIYIYTELTDLLITSHFLCAGTMMEETNPPFFQSVVLSFSSPTTNNPRSKVRKFGTYRGRLSH